MSQSSSAPALHRAPNGQAEANRRNAAHSTGPVTPEGKRRASLNALRHGLTGQTVVLPADDLAAYQRSCAEFHAELKSKGLLETKLVQAIADTYWRLDRIRAMENNLFALAIEEQDPLSSDPLISTALAQAKSLDERSDLLARLSLYEQRLNRTLEKAHAQLKQLQNERAQAEARALEAAKKIHNLKEALKEPWQPEENGFEFSSAQLTAWIERRQLTQEADDFEYRGELPPHEDETPPQRTAPAVRTQAPKKIFTPAEPGRVVRWIDGEWRSFEPASDASCRRASRNEASAGDFPQPTSPDAM